MKTGKNKATNNYIVALWGTTDGKVRKRDNIFMGQIRQVSTGKERFFDNEAQMFAIFRQWFKYDEALRISGTMPLHPKSHSASAPQIKEEERM